MYVVKGGLEIQLNSQGDTIISFSTGEYLDYLKMKERIAEKVIAKTDSEILIVPNSEYKNLISVIYYINLFIFN